LADWVKGGWEGLAEMAREVWEETAATVMAGLAAEREGPA
jgi:hypothetical protein